MATLRKPAASRRSSSQIVPIRPGMPIPDQRRADDTVIASATIARRARAHEPDNEAAIRVNQAVIAVTVQKLPRNNLRCILSTLDARRDFALRLAQARLAKAVAQVCDAEIEVIKALHGWDAARDKFDHLNRLFAHCRTTTMELAATAAPDAKSLKLKIREIGRVWLNAEGDWYQELRDHVEADTQRLTRGQ